MLAFAFISRTYRAPETGLAKKQLRPLKLRLIKLELSLHSSKKPIGLSVALLLGALTCGGLGRAQQKPNLDPIELVRQASRNEIKASDVTHYAMFKDTTQYKDHSITKEIVRTPQGGLTTTLLINGHPLTSDERKKNNEKLEKFAHDTDARRKRREANKAEDKRAETMLTSLPDAFLYTYAGTDRGPKGEELVHLKFRPNPNFVPPNHETAIYQGMQGDLTIDRNAMRIAKIDGSLFKDVDFGWGILGKMYKGGRFIIVQRDVGGGDWEEVEETLQFNGKILMLKPLTIWSTETMTDFRPVPPDITTTQALDLLNKSSELIADGNAGETRQAQNNPK